MVGTVGASGNRSARAGGGAIDVSVRTIDLLRADGVLVIRPTGNLDEDVVASLDDIVRTAEAPLVIDLDHCVLVRPCALDRILAAAADDLPVDICIASRRLSCRRLLSRVGLGDRVAVFSCLEDALHARHATAGSGEPSGLPPDRSTSPVAAQGSATTSA